MQLELVVSGGQTGADEGGLIAARRCGIPTGGTMPKGFPTLAGPRPEFASLYGLVEHPSPKYPPRTEANVRQADATVCFATHWHSPGEQLTKKMTDKHRRPRLEVDPRSPPTPAAVVAWLDQHGVRVLNVAGNSEQRSPGIGAFTVDFLTRVFQAQAAAESHEVE